MVQQEQLALLARVVMQETQERMVQAVLEAHVETQETQEQLALVAAVAAAVAAAVETDFSKIKTSLMVVQEPQDRLEEVYLVLEMEAAAVAVVRVLAFFKIRLQQPVVVQEAQEGLEMQVV